MNYIVRTLNAEADAEQQRVRAEQAEERAEALHVDFATAAFAWEKERTELQTRADDAELSRDKWKEQAHLASRSENEAWDKAIENNARANEAEDRYQAVYADFAAAAFEWRDEAVANVRRTHDAETEIAWLRARARHAEQALANERAQHRIDTDAAVGDIRDLRTRAEKAEAKESDRLRDHMTERRAVVDALGIRIEDNPADELVAAIDDLRVRADKAEAELVEWKARREGQRLANEVLRGSLERAEARAESVEAKYRALYGEFEDAARSWEVERVTLEDRAEQAEVRVMNLEEDLQRASATLTDETNQAARLRSTVIELRTALEEMRNRATSAETRAEQAEAERDALKVDLALMMEPAPFQRRTERAEVPKPRAFRDCEGDVWVEVAPGAYTIDYGYDRGELNLSHAYKNVPLDEVRDDCGPLTEITEG